MGDRVGMQLEITANAKGVTATLKDAQGAIQQTATIIKSQLGGATNDAARGLSQFKEGLGRARETAMFFTASLGEFGPAGRTAQIALSGIAGAIMGGGGILLALEAARVAVRLVTAAWEEERKAAEEAEKARKKAAEEAAKASRDHLRNVQDARDAMRQQRDQMKDPSTKAKLGREIWDAKAEAALMPEGAQKRTAELRIKEMEALAAEIVKMEEAAEAAKRLKEAKEDAERVFQQKQKDGQAALDGRARAFFAQEDAEKRAEEERRKVGQAALDARARAYEREQDLRQKNLQAEIQAQAQIAESIGQTLGTIITSEQSGAEKWKQILSSILGTVIGTAQKTILAHAAGAAAGAAESQAAIPGIGPILAVGAMSAMLAAVQGLLTEVPSAAGGAVIPRGVNPLFQVHSGEHIIPERIARRYEEGAGGGPFIGTLVAADAKSFVAMLEDHGSDLRRYERRRRRRGG